MTNVLENRETKGVLHMTIQKARENWTPLTLLIGSAIGVSVVISWTLVQAHARIPAHEGAYPKDVVKRDIERLESAIHRVEVKVDSLITQRP